MFINKIKDMLLTDNNISDDYLKITNYYNNNPLSWNQQAQIFACKYQEEGYTVIPIVKNQKVTYEGFKYKDIPTPTAEEVYQMWRYEHRGSNIALLTRNFFVVDIDSPLHQNNGVDGLQSAIELSKNYDNELFKPTRVVMTTSGGIHLYYKKPSNLKINMTQKIAIYPAIDIKAHNNNYVLAEPSMINNRYYYTLIDKEPAEPSSDLINLILQKQQETKSIDNKNFTDISLLHHHNTLKPTGANIYLHIIANGLGKHGCRNDTATALAGYLLSDYVQLNVNEALKVMQVANENTDEPLSDKELQKTLLSVAKEVINNGK